MIQSIEVQVISKILSCPQDDTETIDTLMSYPPDLYFLAYQTEMTYIHDQKLQYGVIPSKFSFLAQFPDFEIVDVPEPVEFLSEKLKEYRKYIILVDTFNKLKDFGDGDTNTAWQYLTAQCDKVNMLNDNKPMDIVKEAEKRADIIKEYSKQQRIPTGFAELDKVMYGGLSTVEELFVIVARTNSGKAQPLWAPVLTPSGWTTMGDLKVGDEVVGLNNDIGKVVELFPQGVKEYYRVNFDDGTYAECCNDHLWTLLSGEVKTLKEIKEETRLHHNIPLCYTHSPQDARIEYIQYVFGSLYHIPHTIKCFPRQEGEYVANIARSIGFWVKVTHESEDNVFVELDRTRNSKLITSIECAGETECQCILLDNNSHTYITSDYTVTHNTWVCTKMMETAQKNGFPVAYYSPEMQAAYLGTRFDTWRDHFENNKLYKGDYSQEYYQYIKSLKGSDTSAFVIEDKDFPDGVSVRALDPFIKKNGIKLLIIDGISYMEDDHKTTRVQDKYKNIAQGLFRLSKKYGCATVLVMQANRETKSKDDKGESIPTLYNTEDSDQPGRIATHAVGIRQVFDKHVLDIGMLKSRIATNNNQVFSYAWDINTGQVQYIPGDDADGASSFGAPPAPTAPIATPTFSFGNAQPDANDLSLLGDDDDDDDGLVEF